MNPLIQFKRISLPLLGVTVLVCFPLAPKAHAGIDNTATGDSALSHTTTGSYNTADGWSALVSDTTGSWNTAVGVQGLDRNTIGTGNTATGALALFYNVSGRHNTATGYYALAGGTNSNDEAINPSASYNTADGDQALFNNAGDLNTATGFQALYRNTSGGSNTGDGSRALFGNTTGSFNTASGYQALAGNTTGSANTADGTNALNHNQTGIRNTAVGVAALAGNTTGSANTATGWDALGTNIAGLGNTADGFQALNHNTTVGDVSGNDNTASGYQALLANTTGSYNTAIGEIALKNNTTGSGNVALGIGAGSSLTTGGANIDIENAGVAGESNTIRIGTAQFHKAAYMAGIYNVNESGTIKPVYINSNGQLGTQPPASSRRFKKEIKRMDQTSEAVLSLKPVTFHYKSDKTITPQFGLIAEEVAEVNPDLVVRDDKGEIYTVRYDAVNVMLLNEFLKEHRKVQKLEAALDAVNERLKDQDAKIQKVSAELELGKPARQMVANKP